VEGHLDVFFLSTADEDVLVVAPPSRGAHHKIKPAALCRDQTKFCHIIHLRESNKIVAQSFPSSIRPGSGQCTHLA
jgi:hypothetical protein